MLLDNRFVLAAFKKNPITTPYLLASMLRPFQNYWRNFKLFYVEFIIT